MRESDILATQAWLALAGLRAEGEVALIGGFAERCVAAGVPLLGGRVLVDTLHPLYEGRLFHWRRGEAKIAVHEYGATVEGEALERWRRTPFHRMQASGETLLVAGIDDPALEGYFQTARDEGHSHVLALVDRFGEQGGIGPADCLYSAWCADVAFDEAHVERCDGSLRCWRWR